MTSLPERDNIISLVAEAIATGARLNRACAAINLIPRTLQRWQVDPSLGDLRPEREQTDTNKLTAPEREHLLSIVNSDEFDSLLPPSQIGPILADCGQYLASESTIYRVMRVKIISGIAVPNTLRNSDASRVRSLLPHPTSCLAGTSPICRHG